MDHKHKLGQFMTTNFDYIFSNLFIPPDITHIIEPFTGNGDLLHFIDKSKYIIECYDIEPKKKYIIKKDTLSNPPDYHNKFILTNPPYLARNKSSSKKLFNKYSVNDLYKCFIKSIIDNPALGGIIILPLNFWSSIRKNDIDLRKSFLDIYDIIHLNIFEEKVFDDTNYSICSFQFEFKNNFDIINITIYPSLLSISTYLNNNNNFIIGGDIYNLPINSDYKISRLTDTNKSIQSSNILAKCIDDNINNKINLSITSYKYIDDTLNHSNRTYATLIITPFIKLNKQKKLVKLFNNFLNEQREIYHSLFLPNYRESKDIARKRISFNLIYRIIGYLLIN